MSAQVRKADYARIFEETVTKILAAEKLHTYVYVPDGKKLDEVLPSGVEEEDCTGYLRLYKKEQKTIVFEDKIFYEAFAKHCTHPVDAKEVVAHLRGRGHPCFLQTGSKRDQTSWKFRNDGRDNVDSIALLTAQLFFLRDEVRQELDRKFQ